MSKGGKEVNIRMVQELYEIYKFALKRYQPVNKEQELLFDYAFYFFIHINKMVSRYMLEKHDTFKLKFKSHEARSIVLFWEIVPLPMTPYSYTVITQLIGYCHQITISINTQTVLLN